MIEVKRLLCPVDFSDFSRHAVEHATILAQWYDAEITFLHVYAVPVTLPVVPYGGPVIVEPRPLSGADRSRLFADLGEFVKPYARPGMAVSFEIAEGSPAEQILIASRNTGADMIVLGTHGRSGFERLVLGSVAERVLRKAPVPVLTVPPRATDTPHVSFSRIVCAVDFSESSLQGLRHALTLAQESDARLSVVHVLELWPEAEAPMLPVVSVREFHEQLKTAARDRLVAAIPAISRQFCAIEEIVVAGKAYRELLRIAQEQDADLIVMGLRGRGTADLLLFGSTTQHVVRQATCPVLTLRSELHASSAAVREEVLSGVERV